MPDYLASLRQVFDIQGHPVWFPDELLAADTADSSSFIRDRSMVLECSEWAGLPEAWNERLLSAAARIAADEHLSNVFSLVINLMGTFELQYTSGQSRNWSYDARQFSDWPDPVNRMGELAPLFWVLVSVALVPVVRGRHKECNIPEQITRDTCTGIGSKALDYAFYYNKPGMMKDRMYWFRHHLELELYRIGRLEYMLHKTAGEVKVCENPETGIVRLIVALPDGRGEAVILPDGSVAEDVGVDSCKAWNILLSSDSWVLDTHIPGGGGLTLDSVRDSMQQAVQFYDTYYPESSVTAFQCVSWIFSPDLEGAFSEDSNLIKLRNQVYNYPVPSEKHEGLEFLFGTNSDDPETWPQKTSVQRKLKAHIEKGGRFRHSGMIYLRRDIERLGEFPYG